MGFRAFVEHDFLRAVTRLVVVQDLGNEQSSVLLGNGQWQTVDPGVSLPQDYGVRLDERALQPIAEAIAKHLGKELPSVAEVSVLRETLDKEQERVDRFLLAVVAKVNRP